MTAAAPEPAMCGVHADAIAGWRCELTCARYLCPKCTARLLNRFVCCECGSPAAQLTVPRASKSFLHWLGVAIAYPLRQGLGLFVLTAIVLGGIAFAARLLAAAPGQLDGVSRLARIGVLALYAITMVEAAAHGGEAEGGRALRILRAVVATAIVWVPGAVYVVLVGAPPHPERDAMMWLYAGLGVVYVPAVLAIAAANASFGDVLNPFRVFDLAWNVGRAYIGWLIAVVVLAGVAGAAGAAMFANLRQAVTTPLVSDVVALAPALALVTMTAAMIGLVTFVHGDAFGSGHASQYVDPIHPHLKAEGVRKAAAADATEADATKSTVASGIPQAERADANRLAEALRTENLARALRIYESRAEWSAAAVDDRKLVLIASAATRAKKPELASRLLEKAYSYNGRAAAQALLALAQLRAEVQAQPEEAQAIYRKIVEQHAGTEAARIASKRLAS